MFSGGIHQEGPLAADGHVGGEGVELTPGDGSAQLPGDGVQGDEAGVMAGILVFAVRVSKAHHQVGNPAGIFLKKRHGECFRKPAESGSGSPFPKIDQF